MSASKRGTFHGHGIDAVLLLIVTGALLFWDLGGRPLYAPDEPRYAEIGREMVATGDWLVPRLGGVPYLDKPPLLYWLEAGGMVLLGQNEWGVRLLPAVVSWLGVLLAFRLGLEMFDRATALAGACILASSVLYAGVGRLLLTDGILSVCILGAFLGFWRVWSCRPGAVMMWLCLALSMLAKGPVGPGLFVLAAFPFWLFARPRPPLRRFRPVFGICLVALIVFPWFVFMAVEIPGYLSYFLWNQNVMGLVSPEVHHARPWYYSVVFLGAGLLPWSLLLPQAIVATWRHGGVRLPKPDPAGLLLLLWAAATFGVFTLSVSKLIAYYLPMYPAVSLLVARGLLLARNRLLAPAVLYAVALITPVAGWIALQRAGDFPVISGLTLSLVILALGTALAAEVIRRGGTPAGCLIYLCTLVAAIVPASQNLWRLEGVRSARGLLRANVATLRECEMILADGFPPGMVEFYLHRRVVYVGYIPPRAYRAGLAVAPGMGEFISPNEVDAALKDRPSACLFTRKKQRPGLAWIVGRFESVDSTANYVLLATPLALQTNTGGDVGQGEHEPATLEAGVPSPSLNARADPE